MRKIENKLNIHFFGLPPISVISFPCAARMCLLLIKNANLDLKVGGFGGFYGDRSDLAPSIIVSHISWKKLIRRSNPFLFKSLLFHTYTHTRKDNFAHISN